MGGTLTFFLRITMFLLSLLLISTVSAIDWKDCGDSSYVGKITTLTSSPDPPAKGVNSTIKGSGSADVDISGGDFELQLFVDGVKLLDKKGDFCAPDTIKLPLGSGSLFYPGFPCPYTSGTSTSITLYVALSKAAPPGKVESKLIATSSKKEKIFCVDINFKI